MSARARRHRLLTTSAFVLPVVVLSLCGTIAAVQAVTKSGSGTRAEIAFVGDSNFVRGSGAFVQGLDVGQPGKSDHVDNNSLLLFAVRPGAGIRTIDCPYRSNCATHDYWKAKLSTLFAKATPDAIVTDLGINDGLWPGSPDSLGYMDYAQKIDWFMGLLPSDRPVLWTNLPCAVEPTNYRDGCRIINQSLVAARSRWPQLTIIDWGRLANAHPAYMADDVHYSAAGYQAFAKLIAHTLDPHFPPQ